MVANILSFCFPVLWDCEDHHPWSEKLSCFSCRGTGVHCLHGPGIICGPSCTLYSFLLVDDVWLASSRHLNVYVFVWDYVYIYRIQNIISLLRKCGFQHCVLDFKQVIKNPLKCLPCKPQQSLSVSSGTGLLWSRTACPDSAAPEKQPLRWQPQEIAWVTPFLLESFCCQAYQLITNFTVNVLCSLSDWH